MNVSFTVTGEGKGPLIEAVAAWLEIQGYSVERPNSYDSTIVAVTVKSKEPEPGFPIHAIDVDPYDSLHLSINGAELTEAIARFVVDRSRGKERIAEIEAKVVARHVKELLAGVDFPKIYSMVRELVEAAVKDRFSARVPKVDRELSSRIDYFFAGRYCPAEVMIKEEISKQIVAGVKSRVGELVAKVLKTHFVEVDDG